MSNTSAANVSRGNDLSLSNTPPSMAEGIALCVAFTSTFVLTVAGNLLTIIIFANKNIHKNHFSLVVNMVFVDLSLENVSLPTFTYHVGFELRPWTRWIGTEKANDLSIFSLWSLILFSRRPRLLLQPSYPVRDFTPYIGWWSTEHYQQSIQNRCFYSLDTRSPYLCHLDCIKSPSFLQTHHVHLGAIYILWFSCQSRVAVTLVSGKNFREELSPPCNSKQETCRTSA